MGFNGKMKRQEALSKEDVQLLIEALALYMNYSGKYTEREQFLGQKLQRMEKAFRS